jgi:D-3-phosphoglycerate dehydrogenase / 2-oxoglutarate reductase
VTAFPQRVIVTTVPFGAVDRTPIDLLADAGIDLAVNPLSRRLKVDEVSGVIGDFPVVIAGTEPITDGVMAACPNLKAICRVGIGLDSVDLLAARRRGIQVSYTPDGPSAAVAELAVGLVIDLLRGVNAADRRVRAGQWTRHTGVRVAKSVVGIVGVGRIGRRMIRHLQGGFPGVRILANDLTPDKSLAGVEWVDKGTLLAQADAVSLHVPLTAETLDFVSAREFALMKPSAVLVNTARGAIVNETDLVAALTNGTIRAAAIDVFREEPYHGPLCALPNVLLTCHMGSMTVDCRGRMEIEATRDAIRFLQGQPFASAVPPEEFAIAEYLSRS